ncbi:transporter substrate-binding domain-containing protein [Anaerosacchariphilus polymeriproducens]|uniref:Amino acid ABC transporter substrate-binding protein n=1 Tax=Anaerosacchariphilus polymeriproducens TaxID=1812858 RepID=A0A371AWY8_9FIRM|nr:transporter substrate-binding domain-containing protein [Anaerosacchariphilus polymeriproducens]RDU24022.1 amino acid ABC transporter substrate-binding protein [Anaerosacchariphilus polymeriproducens]
MKKILATMLIAVMAFSLSACAKKEKAVINGPDDLSGKKVGVQTGTTGDLLISDEDSINVERFNKAVEAVQALKQGKIDAVVIDDQPAQVFIKGTKGLKILDTEYVEEDYAISIAKENENLLKDINKAIKELKDDGTLDRIVDYYIGQNKDAKRYESPADIKYSGTLVMATNAEFQPYEYYEGKEIVGLDVDFAKAIADKLGKELKIEDMAFDSIIAAVQSGKADIGCAGMTVTEDRLKSINFTDSYYTGRQVIIVAE